MPCARALSSQSLRHAPRVLIALLASLAVAPAALAQGAPPVGRPPGPPAQPPPATAPPAAVPAAPPAGEPAPAPGGARPPLVPADGGTGAAEPAPPPRPPADAAGPQPGRVPLTPLVTEPSSSGSGTSNASSAAPTKSSDDVFADDWWTHARPVLELHGFYRLRAELLHNFSLGRDDPPSQALWPRPIDYSYIDAGGTSRPVKLCGDQGGSRGDCQNRSQAGANMRFRIDPELHISDNLRIVSQIDLLDNIVLGSTPYGYYNQYDSALPGQPVQREVGAQNPYNPRSVFTQTTEVPQAEQNSFSNSVRVKRVYGEYMTPVGMLRFGRQPNHWGLGILANAGDGYDSDWQSTVDRIMFTTGLKSLDAYASVAWDFPHEGATSQNAFERQGQPYDLGQLDDVNQYTVTLARKRSADLARQDLAAGQAVINGGLFFVYRKQTLANDSSLESTRDPSLGQPNEAVSQGLTRRKAEIFTPDLWIQVMYRKFRFEAEWAGNFGSLENTAPAGEASDYFAPRSFQPNGWKIRDQILATQTELKLVEDKLRLQLGFGWASGDPDVWESDNRSGSYAGGLSPRALGLPQQRGYDRTFSMGRFHPDYRVDLIMFRNILSRVQGAYYLRPSVEYDFARNVNGQKFGGGAAFIWSRASQAIQTPGRQPDLGIELDLTLYYQAKDGSLNDNHNRTGGFYTFLQYGVLFPLGGFSYLSQQRDNAAELGARLDTGSAQTLRWYMGVLF
ncbi:MAG: TIGR04551 family protein [Polyangiaceae bacterium]|nr:TIGR04551 family protein [Polyangiaceae bacterium]